MEISGTQDQMNSMMENMEGVNQQIKQHNDGLKNTYNGAISNAKSNYQNDISGVRTKAEEEGGLNVSAKFGGAIADFRSVSQGGKNYFTSATAWDRTGLGGKAVSGIKSAGQSVGNALSSSTSSFKPGGIDAGAGDMLQKGDISYSGEQAGAGTDVSGGLGANPENVANESYGFEQGTQQPDTPGAPKPDSTSPPSEGGNGEGGAGGEEAGADALGDAGSDAGKLVKGIGKVAGGVGTALSVAGGFNDLAQDISAGKVVGDNKMARAGNVLGIMAGATDAISEAVPIFAPLGALFGLASAITSGVGDIEDKDATIKANKDDLAGKGNDPSPNEAYKSTTSIQSAGLIASQGAPTPTQQVGGTGAF